MLLAYVPFAFGLIPSGSSPEVLRSKTGFCFWLILRGLTKQQKRVHLLGLSKNKETSDDHPFYSRKHSLHWALSIVIKMRSCWTYPLPLLVPSWADSPVWGRTASSSAGIVPFPCPVRTGAAAPEGHCKCLLICSGEGKRWVLLLFLQPCQYLSHLGTEVQF